MQLLGQLWHQSPLIMMMVGGLVSFGVYAVVGYLRDRPLDDQPSADAPQDAVPY